MAGKFLSILAGAAAAVVIAVPASADNGRLRIPRADCLRLVPHDPDPDVAYKPGVDVRGKPVAPADLPDSGLQIELPDQVEFDISFSPFRGTTASRFGDTDLYVGTVRYNLKTGEATLNGAPLTVPQKAEIAARCREVLRRQ
jgi:hypothetical protein